MKKVKLIISAVIVCIMLMTVQVYALDLTKDTSYQPEGTTILSIGKPVDYSTVYESASGAWTPSRLNDGLIGAESPIGFTTDPTDPEAQEDYEAYVQIDLEKEYKLSRIVLWPRQDTETLEGYPVDFKLQISTDGNNWTDVASKTDQRDLDKEGKIFDFTPAVGRYVRVFATKLDQVGDQFVMQFAEVAVYGADKDAVIPTTKPNDEKPNPTPDTGDSGIPLTISIIAALSAAAILLLRNKTGDGSVS